jgi:hypothetical protein
MNTDQMTHERVKLTNEPHKAVYLDDVSITMYQEVLAVTDMAKMRFQSSASKQNNYAKQAIRMTELSDIIVGILRSDCKHIYTDSMLMSRSEEDKTYVKQVTKCTKCNVLFP